MKVQDMTQRYRKFQRSWGMWYAFDNATGNSVSLKTRVKAEAVQKVNAMNETERQPGISLGLARVYLNATDPKLATRTWQDVMEDNITKKTEDTLKRWQTAIKDRNFDFIRKLHVCETRPEHFDRALADAKPSTNVYLRRIHNHALGTHYNAARTACIQPNRNITAKFMLLHTLAHVLINQLSFDCGYGSASLRERLYCDFTDPSEPMHGFLIYTASGDSEGTMGGLVRQGKPGRLETTLRRALKHAAWCSSDPVCIESKGQGSDNSNLAACHGCCLLPETSCEEGNRLLDHALLIGTPASPALGFFSELLYDQWLMFSPKRNGRQ